MTKEEAVRHLSTWSTTHGSGRTTQDQHEEAKRIAIQALRYWIAKEVEDKAEE